jgi:hypothetical protein
MEKLASEKEKITQRIAKLEMKERLIREKERKQFTKQLIKLGEFVSKAEIDQLDPEVLLGALLDIKDLSSNADKMKQWKEKGKYFLEVDVELNPQPLIISSASDLPIEIKSALRERKFRWNQFRHEWYGYGKIEELQEFLTGQNANVEIVGSED